MLDPRWRKLRGDLRAARGRVALLVAALAVSLAAVGTVLGAHEVLDREIEVSYLSSRPAEATLVLPGGVDRALLDQVRARPDVADADAREVVTARMRLGAASARAGAHAPGWLHAGGHAEWKPLKLFVADDFEALRLNVFRRESGAWPPPLGTLLLERTAVMIVGAAEGQTVTVKAPHGEPQQVMIAGVVHDAGLAPAWQEHTGYAYATRETLAALGEPPVLHELRVSFRPASASRSEVEARASALASWLSARDYVVEQIRVPGLHQHPHQALMDTALMVLLAFALLLFLLSAVLVAATLSAMLARQVREIGVMKAVGARRGQLAVMYAVGVGLVGLAALSIALPLAVLGAQALISAAAFMLNIGLTDRSIPLWVFAAAAAAGALVPLAVAAVPIRGAVRLTVRDALARHGTRSELVRPLPSWWPMAARNALRQPGRFALGLALLTAGGAMAMTAVNIKAGFERTLARVPEMRHDDLEIRFGKPERVALAEQLGRVPGVRAVETWGHAAAAFAQPGRLAVVNTYPDGGHGSFSVFAPPANTALVSYPIAAGRWLEPDDTDALVVNQRLARSRGLRVGERVTLSLDGIASSWEIVGIADEIPPTGAFVNAAAFARATRTEGRATLLRIATSARSDAERRHIVAGIERALSESGASVAAVTPFSRLYSIIEDHLVIFGRAAVLVGGIVVLVGLLGLAAAIGVSVAERTRELGVMKAIGATGARVARLVVGEAILVGMASWVLSAAVSLPLTFSFNRILNSMVGLPASFSISPWAIVGWLVVVLLGSAAAALLPARRAALLTVHEAIAEV